MSRKQFYTEITIYIYKVNYKFSSQAVGLPNDAVVTNFMMS